MDCGWDPRFAQNRKRKFENGKEKISAAERTSEFPLEVRPESLYSFL